MDAVGPPRRSWLRRPLLFRGLAVAAACGLLLLLTAATASTPLGMRVATLFGGIVDAIRRHPSGTAVLALGGLAALWLGIGLAALSQWWLAPKEH